ncbi:MAG TPA: hypothetical protein VGB15_08780 [Longimicrobium sp.]|jgi:hypothetical protein
MRPISLIIATAALLLAFPVPAAAQCTWGCACRESACGCNSTGSGSGCVNGGNGCVVYRCAAEEGPVVLAPDGSAARPALDGTGKPAEMRTLFAAAPVQSRWEYRAPGRSVARHCSGIVVARYFDRTAAADVRRRQRTLTI